MIVGELTIKFHDNEHIELDDSKAQQVPIGQIYKAGKELLMVGVFIRDIDRLAIDNDGELNALELGAAARAAGPEGEY